MSAPGEEPVPSPGVHVHLCVLLHMHGVPGMLLGAGTLNHEGMQHMNIAIQSCCQHRFKDQPPQSISGPLRPKRPPKTRRTWVARGALNTRGQSFLISAVGELRGIAKRAPVTFQGSYPTIQAAPP